MKGLTQTVDTSPALRRLLLELQTRCIADCCKGRAFQITESAISLWLEYERIDRTCEIAEEVGNIRADLHRATGSIVLAARGLESNWDAAEFRAFWENFEAEFKRAVQARVRAGA